MLLIYHIKEKVFTVKDNPGEPHPVTGKQGIRYIVTQPYVTSFWIPTVARRKQVRAYTIDDMQPIPAKDWTPQMTETAARLRREAPSGWYLNFLLLLFAVGLSGLFLWGFATSGQAGAQEDYFADPREGDIILVRVHPHEDTPVLDLMVCPFKIQHISNDTLYVRRGTQCLNPQGVYNPGQWKKFSRQFSTADTSFSPRTETYSRSGIKTAERLIRPKALNEDPNDTNRLDDEFFTNAPDHILEVKYIIRP